MRAACAVVSLVLLIAACSDADPPTSTPTVPPTLTSPTAEATSSLTTPQPPAAPTPQLGVSFTLEPFAVDAPLVPDGNPEGADAPFVVDLETNGAMRWAGVSVVTPSPFDDRVLGVVYGGANEPDATALLDLASGTIEGVLPLSASVLQWPDADRIFVLIDPRTFGRPGSSWQAGIYALDLEARTIELVSRGGGGRILSPDGSMTLSVNSDIAPGVVVRDPRSGRSVYSFLSQDDTGTRSIRLGSAAWLEDNRIAISREDRSLLVVDPRTTSRVDYQQPDDREPYAVAMSPDGRLLSVVLSSGEYAVDLRQDTVLLDATTLESVLGPIENATPVRWSPDGHTLIMRGAACGPDGDWVEVLDLASGTSRRVAPEVNRLFYLDASLDASKVVGGVWEDWVVIDVASGDVDVLPPLGVRTEAPPYVLDVPAAMQFSGSGRWLVANVERGGEGC